MITAPGAPLSGLAAPLSTPPRPSPNHQTPSAQAMEAASASRAVGRNAMPSPSSSWIVAKTVFSARMMRDQAGVPGDRPGDDTGCRRRSPEHLGERPGVHERLVLQHPVKQPDAGQAELQRTPGIQRLRGWLGLGAQPAPPRGAAARDGDFTHRNSSLCRGRLRRLNPGRVSRGSALPGARPAGCRAPPSWRQVLAGPGDAGPDRADRAVADGGGLGVGAADHLGQHERRPPVRAQARRAAAPTAAWAPAPGAWPSARSGVAASRAASCRSRSRAPISAAQTRRAMVSSQVRTGASPRNLQRADRAQVGVLGEVIGGGGIDEVRAQPPDVPLRLAG